MNLGPVLRRAGAGWLLALAMMVPASPQDNQQLSARIRRLEDTEEIRTLLLNYGRYLDARDFAAYSLLFAKDGEWIGGFGTVKGPAAIQAFMEKNIPGPNQAHNYHVLTNFVIDVHGDTAAAWSRWTFVVPGPDKRPVMAQGGRYEDSLVRENGHWKFKRRVARNDIPDMAPAAQKK